MFLLASQLRARVGENVTDALKFARDTLEALVRISNEAKAA